MCWHKWGKWAEVAKGDLLRYTDSSDLTKKIHAGLVSYQERTCSKCNLVEKGLHCAIARINITCSTYSELELDSILKRKPNGGQE